MKKSMLLALLTVALPVAVHAQFTYTTNGNGLTVTGYTGANNTVIIPSSNDGLPVTTVGASAFANTTLTDVTIPDSVICIESYAFAEDFYLSSIIFGINVSSIGSSAFHDCADLTSVALPDSLTNIEDMAFANSGLTNVVIPDNVITIGEGAFYFDIVGPVTIGTNVTSIGENAFFLDDALTSVNIPNSVTNIGDSAFAGCTSLSSVNIGTNVISIGDFAFSSDALTNVIIPASVTSIGTVVFDGCLPLAQIEVGARNANYTSVNGVLFDRGVKNLLECPDGIEEPSYSIPQSVTNIGANAFESCLTLVNVTIPNSVVSIGDWAFARTDLAGIVIPDSVVSIGGYAFAESAISSAIIGNGLTTLVSDVFYDCTALTSVTIGDGIKVIEDWAFYGCPSLTSLHFTGNAPIADASIFFPANQNVTVYYVPGTTGWAEFATKTGTSIAPWSFANPQILTNNPDFGVQNNVFGFTVFWTTNASIVVEACSNLASAVWYPVATNNLTNGSFYFSEPLQSSAGGWFYRVSSR